MREQAALRCMHIIIIIIIITISEVRLKACFHKQACLISHQTSYADFSLHGQMFVVHGTDGAEVTIHTDRCWLHGVYRGDGIFPSNI